MRSVGVIRHENRRKTNVSGRMSTVKRFMSNRRDRHVVCSFYSYMNTNCKAILLLLDRCRYRQVKSRRSEG